ncbi:MAG TPA: glycolate oxidase subunit GlcF [Stellaceae bacterium]|nr:glycolate oxidase subunit GlcF [Stellaceae bacterium]
MQTNFSLAQLADPELREADKILRTCVHCGFCTATCPTYVLLGDELDGPRGRIYLIKEMLENRRDATAPVVKHIDRCLSCLSCMTTCPSGVHYMHLVDQARQRIEATYKRPFAERWLRRLLATVLPRPGLFRLALVAAKLARPAAALLPGRLATLARMAPRRLRGPAQTERPQVFPAMGTRRKRVALLTGCAQQVLAPEINEATVRLLTRHGCEVVVAEGAGCCGGIVHHMGRDALHFAKRNIDAWTREIEGDGLDAIIINTSGCGVTVKDYGYMLRSDVDYRKKSAQVSALTKDITELMAEIGIMAPVNATGRRVAYHVACSLQHGQKVLAPPKQLLAAAGFTVLDIPEAHLCCGSAGTYNMLQPAIAERLGERKVRNIESTKPELVAAGNVGCIEQIARGTDLPVVHTVELLDWATGGPMPAALSR